MSDGLDTFPKLLARNAREFGAKPALREKEFGIWQALSWQQYHDKVRDFSLGLVSLGFERGDKVAIIGNNRPEWVCAELAAQAADRLAHGGHAGVKIADQTLNGDGLARFQLAKQHHIAQATIGDLVGRNLARIRVHLPAACYRYRGAP